MSLFGRIKNIVRSNINSGKKMFSETDYSDLRAGYTTNFAQEEYDCCANEPTQSPPSLEEQYYANLELPCGANFEEIKSAYKKLLKKYHPDKFYGDEKKLAVAQNVVKKLNEAYSYFENKYNK